MKPGPLPPEPDDIGPTIRRLATGLGESLADLSRLVGRRDGYLQSFVSRERSGPLPDDVRRTLARYFGVSERELGGPE